MSGNKLLTIVLLFALTLGVLWLYNQSKDNTNESLYGNEDLSGDTDIDITITYFDENGNIIETQSFLMAIETIPQEELLPRPPAGAYDMLVNISITNTGNVPLTMSMSDFLFTGTFK